MKSALRLLLVWSLSLVAGLGAQAQGDEVLERYGIARANLSASIAQLDEDPAASREELDRAAGSLRFLASNAGRPELMDAMERVFERARTAIGNRSRTDLVVQTALLSGGFQRALYDSAIGAWEEERSFAVTRLDRLAGDLDLDPALRTRIDAQAGLLTVTRLLEEGVARRVAEGLEQASEQYAEDPDTGYVSLARAYGDFLLVQDSPRADSDLNETFANAAQALIEGDSEGLGATLAALSEDFRAIAQAAREANEAASQQASEAFDLVEGQEPAEDSGEDQPTAGEGQPEDESAGDGTAVESAQDGAGQDGVGQEVERQVGTAEDAAGQEVADQADDAAQQPASEGGTATGAPASDGAAQPAQTDSEPQGATGSEAGSEGARSPAATARASEAETDDDTVAAATTEWQSGRAAGTGTMDDAGTDETVAEDDGTAAADTQQATAQQLGSGVLRRQLTLAGVSSARAEGIASNLAQSGYSGLDEAVDHLYALSGRLISALRTNDPETAQGALDEFEQVYGNGLGPAIELLSPSLHERVERVGATLETAPAPRASDAQTLLMQVAEIDGRLAGDRASTVTTMSAEVTTLWSDWVRPVVFILLALLAIVPLYLLNMAFGGGGNRNWRFVGAALFLLLLPMMWEGLIALGSLAAELSGMSELALLSPYSLLESSLGHVLWGLLTALAIISASIGLYGICVQFGLIGSRRAGGKDSQQTMISRQATGVDTVVDWDEEF